MTEMEAAESNFKCKDQSLKIRSYDQLNGRDSWFLAKDQMICKVTNVILLNTNQELSVTTYSFQRAKSYFTEPIDSKLLGICVLDKNSKSREKTISIDDLEKKYVAIMDVNDIILIINFILLFFFFRLYVIETIYFTWIPA